MQQQIVSEQNNTKKSYQTPELKALGSVEQLTQGIMEPGGSSLCIYEVK